ncbi:MAG: Uma2 family endonuclease [Gemmataceae bacterium]|nr:Uma2 family endonuclease [Gemmataceae bacterium]
MSTAALKLGPADHGRPVSLDDFEAADFGPGVRYEIIDGRVYVSPPANFPENRLETWLYQRLLVYADGHPDVANYVTNKPRVFVHKRRRATVPEPDIAAYRGVDLDADPRDLHWRDLGPVLVVEVLVEGDVAKDLERNVELYFEVPSVREYWVLDGRADPNRPALVQRRRHGRRWVVREYPYGSTFTTKLLPGFSLPIDPRR